MSDDRYQRFANYLDQENKDEAVAYILSLLESGALTIEEIYAELLVPSLTNYACPLDDQEICIWKEHTRTSIVRTILEATYPYVIARKPKMTQTKKLIVLCPEEEYHEIGAIMVANYFAMAGFNAQYIGANTPKHDILSAVKAIKPDFLALSVTNYYNVVVTKKITEALKANYPEVKIIIGGQAFRQEDALKQVTYDYHIDTLEDIMNLAKAVLK